MTLPPGLEDAFGAAAGELGHVSASWLYVREVQAESPQGVAALRDALGRAFPVLDAVAAQAESGRTGAAVDLAPVRAALQGVRRLVVVGLEADFLDPLVAGLEGVELGLLAHGSLAADYDRVLANFRGRMARVELPRVQAWAGPRSALLCFSYGTGAGLTHVPPEWLRVAGPDTRTHFRTLVAWDALQGPLHVYPRWLEQVEAASFTHLV